ncbi:protein prenyltransferase alpha subunit repeat-containing protein 1 [Denticeps clupeoides]|uniref:Protein prenyltransferase alpha subunit repeat-containing protein 1 n=1 Tax=Denticeps clupeoides TaxID=299321 RepID=A0AAY4C6F7_9TELE|nr:protein prenyltransferase alpha subunit repeat-containing protein 1 [Denticeps clupeoides]
MAESEEEVDVLVQRVMKDISNAFKKNPNIDEIGLIPCPEARCNRSPIVLVENKLGVESWCVKFLLPYVHNKLLLYRQRKLWLDREVLIDVTCTLLLLNPDFTTAWNVRKELLQCGLLSPEKDLYLGKLALTKFPKSPDTWIHRRWVLQQVQRECCPQGSERKEHASGHRGDSTPHSERLQRLLHEEIKVCSDAAGRYPSNYNAWSHRIWVLQNLAKGNLKVLHDELSSMSHWVSMHVSDHSGFHYRQFLLKALVTELSQGQNHPELACGRESPQLPLRTPAGSHSPPQSNGDGLASSSEDLHEATVPHLFHDEMELCTDLIETYPGHETLWCHRRHVFFLWHHWKQQQRRESGSIFLRPGDSCNDPLVEANGESANGQPMDVDGVSDRVKHGGYTQDSKRRKRGPEPPCPRLTAEHNFIDQTLATCRSPEQRRFATAYRKWLDSVIVLCVIAANSAEDLGIRGVSRSHHTLQELGTPHLTLSFSDLLTDTDGPS